MESGGQDAKERAATDKLVQAFDLGSLCSRRSAIASIEEELGYRLEWEELPARRDSRISIYLSNVDPEEERDWPRQHEWLAAKLNDMHRVFSPRIRALDADEWQGETDPNPAIGRNQSTNAPDG